MRDRGVHSRVGADRTIDVTPSASADSVLCARCGYDLRSLDFAGRCPECGLPIQMTHAARMLTLLSPRWLGGMAMGVRLCRGAMTFMFVVVSIAMLLGAFASVTQVVVLANVGVVLSIVVSLAGIWLMTRAPDLRVLPVRMERARLVAHWMSGVVAIGCFGAILSMGLAPRETWTHVVLVLLTPFGLCGVVGGIAFGLYCRQIGELVADPFVAGRGGFYLLVFSVGGAFALPLEFASLFPGWTGAASGVYTLGACSVPIALIGLLGGGALILSLPIYLDKTLPGVRAEAERIWREAGGGVDGDPQTEGTE
ncbi:MAG TPA: hypothetical protein P5081_02505 [Phycisphaerae bacterium]|nr:hypothetical protein [Phycisphaerae bacterium]HRW51728.1 hypothetical protein [Phycisphaerae bacterium]